MWHTPKTGYNKSFLLHMLWLQLSQELGTALLYQATKLTTMDKLVHLCQSLDNCQQAEQYHQHSRMVLPLAHTVGTAGTLSQAVPSHPASSPATSTATGTHPGLMDTSAGKLRAKWVTSDMLSEQRAKGLCGQCRLKQHFVSQCVLLPTRWPQITTAGAQAPEDAKVEVAELETKKR